MADEVLNGYEVTEDVPFGWGEKPSAWGDLVMDTYLPQSWTPGWGNLPAVVMVPGGGFTACDKQATNVVAHAAYLARRGFAVFVIEHRVGEGGATLPTGLAKDTRFDFHIASGTHTDFVGPPNERACRHAAAVDLKRAIRHVRANAATYGVDANDVHAWGHSSGAATVSLVACSPDDWFVFDDPATQAVDDADEDGTNGTTNNHGTSAALKSGVCLWGRHDSTLVSATGATNPTGNQSKADPPLLLMHGDADPTVPYSHSEDLQSSLVAVGNDRCDLVTLTGAQHGGGSPDAYAALVDDKSVQWYAHDWLEQFADTEGTSDAAPRVVQRTVTIPAGLRTVSGWVRNPGRLVAISYLDDDADWVAAAWGVYVQHSIDAGETGPEGSYRGNVADTAGNILQVAKPGSFGWTYHGFETAPDQGGGVFSPFVRVMNTADETSAHQVVLHFEVLE